MSKSKATADLRDVIPLVSRALASGRQEDAYKALRRVLPPKMAGRALLELARTELPERLTHRRERLTELEGAVLRASADGLTAEATARRLRYAPETIKSVRSRLIAKAGAKNMTQAVHTLLAAEERQ